jgi:hypothetical protein
MKEAKIYKSVWQVVVLSGERVGAGTSFEEMVEKIDEGRCLGSYSLSGQEEIVGTEEIVRACEEVGNDGSFLAFLLEEEEEG